MPILPEDAIDRVLLVGATRAINDYKNLAAYVCQPNRYQRPCARMAFYFARKIDRRVPMILGFIDNCIISRCLAKRFLPSITEVCGEKEELIEGLNNLFKEMKERNDTRMQKEQKIVLLTSESDPRTVWLKDEIQNDKLSRDNKIVTFVQSQRYVSFHQLKKSTTTTGLEKRLITT
jgi:hypothetical protein